jgi:hypothetical protein
MKTEKEMREYAIGAAAYWLDCSEHEQTPEDAKILARYARLAIDRIVELETALAKYGGHGGPAGSPICESLKHSAYPCTCGFEAAIAMISPPEAWASQEGGG